MDNEKASSKVKNDRTQISPPEKDLPEETISKVQKKSKPQKKPAKNYGICESVQDLELKVQEIKKQLSSKSHPRDYFKSLKDFKASEKSKKIEFEKEKIQRYNQRMESKILTSAKNWTKSRKPSRKEGFLEDCQKLSKLLNDFEDDEIFMKFSKILKKRADLANFNYYEPDMMVEEDVSLHLDWLEVSEELFYRGEMKNHKPEGRGVLLSRSELYEGYFSNGHKQGLGRQVTRSAVYTGYWFNSLYSGFGTLVKKRTVYSGEFESGHESGFGVFKRPEARYEGSWKNGQYHGNGVIKFNDGRIYKGEFFNGAIKGYGSFILPKGKSLVGYWENGEIVGSSQQIYLPKEEIPIIPEFEARLDSIRSETALSLEIEILEEKLDTV